MAFSTVYCIDGSGNKDEAAGDRKRPIYRLEVATGEIARALPKPDQTALEFFIAEIERQSRPFDDSHRSRPTDRSPRRSGRRLYEHRLISVSGVAPAHRGPPEGERHTLARRPNRPRHSEQIGRHAVRQPCEGR